MRLTATVMSAPSSLVSWTGTRDRDAVDQATVAELIGRREPGDRERRLERLHQRSFDESVRQLGIEIGGENSERQEQVFAGTLARELRQGPVEDLRPAVRLGHQMEVRPAH